MTNVNDVNYQHISSLKETIMKLGDQAIENANQLELGCPLRMAYLTFANHAYSTCVALLKIRESLV